MNKRGQSLITFVLFLPLIVMFLAFIIDGTLSSLRKNRIDGIITSNMEFVLEKDIKDINKIENVIKKNDDDIEVMVGIDEDILNIYVKDNNKSIFKTLINNRDFRYCASYIDKKINKKCG